MNTIDYIYRFDPKNPSTKPPPPDADVARRNLGFRAMPHRIVTLNPQSRCSDGNSPELIDTSLGGALLDIKSVVARLCGETSGARAL